MVAGLPIADGDSAAMDDSGTAKAPNDSFSSVHKVGGGFHRELEFPLPPLDIGDLQIAHYAVHLHLENINVSEPPGLDEIHLATKSHEHFTGTADF